MPHIHTPYRPTEFHYFPKAIILPILSIYLYFFPFSAAFRFHQKTFAFSLLVLLFRHVNEANDKKENLFCGKSSVLFFFWAHVGVNFEFTFPSEIWWHMYVYTHCFRMCTDLWRIDIDSVVGVCVCAHETWTIIIHFNLYITSWLVYQKNEREFI